MLLHFRQTQRIPAFMPQFVHGLDVLLEDHLGRLWVGTDDGLNLYDATTERFTRFTTTKGMTENAIISLQEDDDGNIWVATEAGISHVNGNTGVIINYNQSLSNPLYLI